MKPYYSVEHRGFKFVHLNRWFEFGRSFGPQHLVMAATRYDPNACLIVDVDTKAMTHRLVNLDLVFAKTPRRKRSGI